MLCDTVVEHVGTLLDSPKLASPITRLAEKLVEAERFVLSPEMMAACWQLTMSKPSALLDATKFCRVPFKSIWMEWEGHVPGRSKNGANVSNKFAIAVPKRFGVLIECFDDTHRRFGVSSCWSFDKTALPPNDPITLAVCPLGVVVNWHDGWLPAGASNAEIDQFSEGHFRQYLHNPIELDAIRELSRMIMACVPPHFQPWMERMRQSLSADQIKNLMEASAHDLKGESNIILAALCLLNSKNCIEIEKTEEAPLKKMNKARMARGKAPFFSYSTVKIALSKRDKKIASENGVGAAEIRQHIVRGHFKIRKTGIYWWRPFLRGDAAHGVVKRSTYEVTP